jgi:MFS family permease
VILSALTWLLVRSTPESCGLVPIEADPSNEVTTGDATLADALSSAAFWTYSLAAASFGLIWSAITLFNEQILNAHGFGRDDFMLVMAVLAGTGLLSNMLAGWALGFWPMGRVMGIGMLMLSASVGMFPWIRSDGLLLAYAMALGIAGGMITVVFFTFYGRAFGRMHLGLIQGAAHLLSVIASALGPVLLTWQHGQTGSYDGMFLALAPVIAILGIAAWVVPVRPKVNR